MIDVGGRTYPPDMKFIDRIYRTLVLSFLLLCTLTGLAFAAAVDPNDPTGILQTGLEAITKHEWWLLAGCALSGLHLLLRSYGPFKSYLGGGDDQTHVQRDWRGFVSIVVMGLLGGIGHAWLAGGADIDALKEAFSTTILITVFKVVATAVTAYVGLKKTVPALTTPPSS